MKAILVDLDGTVANCDHRLHHVTGGKKDWPAFFAKASADTPIEPTLNTISALKLQDNEWRTDDFDEREIIFVSGRPESLRQVSNRWLEREYGGGFQLLMRPDNDTRPDHVVKEEILDKILGQGYEIECVFDDRPSVIEMWKRRGLHVFQVHHAAQAPLYDDPKATLHLLVGPSHAGKTTWFQETTELPLVSYLSSDAIRLQLTGDEACQTRNDEVFALMHTLTRVYLQAGVDVIYDATNIRRKDRINAAALAHGGPVVYHVFDRPLDQKLASIRHGFPPAVIEKHHQTFQSQIKDILAGDHLPNVTVEDHR